MNSYSFRKLSDYFGCDFMQFKNTRSEYDSDLCDVFDDNGVVISFYRLPSKKTDLTSLISVAENLGSRAVAITLKAVNSYDMKDYIAFFDNAESLSGEIKRLHLDNLLKNNPVCEFIVESVEKGNATSARKELNSALEERLKHHSLPIDLAEVFEESAKPISLYQVAVCIDASGYRVYDTLLSLYGEEQILSNEKLLEFALYNFACIVGNCNQMSAKYRKKCIGFLPQALRFVKAYNYSKWFCDDIIMYAVTDSDEREYNKISEYFDRYPSDMFLRHTVGIRRQSNEKKYIVMRDKLVRFIELTGNKFACEYLLKIVLTTTRIEDFRAVKWERLRSAKDKRITAAELLFDENKDCTKQIKELFSDADAVDFICTALCSLGVKELSSLKCDCSDIYANMLSYYKERGDVKSTVDCERKINEIIAATVLKEGLLK